VIGQGGMGVVYRAVHEETGAVVALKTVRVTSADLLASIRREVLALRKVAHPDVVRIEEVGVTDVGPWYAMELLEGETLRDNLSRLWGLGVDAMLSEPDDPTMDLSRKISEATIRQDAPPSIRASAPPLPLAACGALDEILTLFRRLCIPLAFMHGQGIVHRDLKPANVFLRTDGSPVLMDFGVVATAHGAAGREVVDVGSQMVGTTGYMAPEQISGERVDARCDLYALGCMLYEALTGSVPFVGRTAMEVVGMHLMQAPVPPSMKAAGVPPALDQLVLRLLAKTPRERIGHADDVARSLWEISQARQGGEARLSTPIVKPSAYLYRPGIIGREETLAALQQRVRDLGEGRGGIVLLGGESGVGKTRIVAEIAQHAGRANVLVAAGECVSLPRASGAEPGRTATNGGRTGPAREVGVEGRGSALHPLRGLFQAIADRCSDEGEATFAKWLGTWARVLALYEPSIAAVTGFAELPELPELSAPAARRRALEAVRDTLAAVSKDEALMLVIDDLQWADDLTITLLASLNPAFFAKHRVLVVGTFRDDELGDTLPRLLASEAVTQVKVGSLAGRSVSALVSDMLALAEPPTPLVDFLAERSQGNPFYVSEYLRMAIAEGILSRDLDGRWLLDERGAAALPTPSSLLDLVGRRLRGLAPDARAVVEAAAVLGREAETSVLVAVSGLPEASVIDALRELSHRQILEEAGGDRFRLVHDKLREAAWRDLAPPRRKALHLRAAEALETTLRRHPEMGMLHGDLAMHWREAGEPEREAFHAGLAGERSYRDGAFADAIRYLRIAIEWHRGRAHDDATRLAMARWCWQAGDASFVMGDFKQAERWLVAAMEPYEPGVPETPVRRAGYLLGHVLEQVEHGLRMRRANASEREGLTIAAHAAGKLAHVAIFRGDAAAVLAASLAAANLAERAGDAHVDALGTLGYAAGTLGLDALAQRYFDRAGAAATAPPAEAGVTWRGRSAASLLEAVWRMGRDERARARGLIDEAIAQTRFNGDRLDEGLCTSVLAMLHWYDGRIDAMRDAVAVAMDALGDDMFGQRAALIHTEAFAHLSGGDLPAGKAALAMLGRYPDRADALVRSLNQSMQSLVHLGEGRLDEAVALADEALRGVGNERAIPPTAVHLWQGTLEVFQAAQRAGGVDRGSFAAAVVRTQRWAKAHPVGRALAMRWGGTLAWAGGDATEASARWREALALAREGGQRGEAAHAEALLALYIMPAGPEREEVLARARALWERNGATGRLRWLERVTRG
jgi:serine/threonine protein kinase/tetratricopeptide (TPR) repeat protein